MGELRVDPITGRAVVVVPGRSARPNEHAAPAPQTPSAQGCPFCEGNEDRTPAEVGARGPPSRRANEKGWYVRTIPNRFPTVGADEVATASARSSGELTAAPQFGFHEVVIESPAHSPLLPYLPREQVARVLEVCRERVRELLRAQRVRAVMMFENTGPESGGSLWHPHAQLVATASVPPALQNEIDGAERYRQAHSVECAFEAVRDQELRAGSRTIVRGTDFDAFAPFASEFPFESRIMPRRHSASFGEATSAELEELASLLPRVLRALLKALPGASYNLLVRSPGGSVTGAAHYHWHLDICPRLVRPDGFDIASGFAVNTVPPETAAAALVDELGAKS